MFRRLIFEDYAALCTIVAFVTAATIFAAIVWRALRMSRAQVTRMENLPFTTEPASLTDHEHRA